MVLLVDFENVKDVNLSVLPWLLDKTPVLLGAQSRILLGQAARLYSALIKRFNLFQDYLREFRVGADGS